MLGYFFRDVCIVYYSNVIFKKGDRLVSGRALFGSCHFIITEILPKFGIEVKLVDGTNLNQWENALKKTKVVFLKHHQIHALR